MMPCVILLSLDRKDAADSDNGLTTKEMQLYGIYAVIMGLTAPFIWTFKAYYIRCTLEKKEFPILDLSLDQNFFYGILSSSVFLIYLSQYDFEMNVFIEGQITGVFFGLGTVCTMCAYDYGPGGPVNALICTQIIYQTAINALFFD